ncbi:MAG: dinitrogenase iron-molybdenum cofactor biosynthesis protein [Tissierellia bacterium]|jgi:predicted Fe-Mo cluster-binding NifX family protein|nr:dinitrogenase iron-molybdenum cofactor biosynthesis protein [Tissierellia bacterium]
MKIAIPVNDNNLKSGVCASYGRAPYYYIYDQELNEGVFIENLAASDSGGVGIKAAQILIDYAVKVLLTPRLGDHAAAVLNKADIAIHKSSGEGIEENLEAFLQGKLQPLSEIHAGLHGN